MFFAHSVFVEVVFNFFLLFIMISGYPFDFSRVYSGHSVFVFVFVLSFELYKLYPFYVLAAGPCPKISEYNICVCLVFVVVFVFVRSSLSREDLLDLEF